MQCIILQSIEIFTVVYGDFFRALVFAPVWRNRQTRGSQKAIPKRSVGSIPTTPIIFARMLELVDGGRSKRPAEKRVGSSPTLGINYNIFCYNT